MTEDKGVDRAVACSRDVVDAEELVAAEHAHLLRRSAGDDFLHAYGVVDHGEGDAHPLEVALQGLVGALHLAGGDIDAVGVEGAEHGAHGLFAQAVGVGVGDILRLDEVHHLLQAFHARHGVGDDDFVFLFPKEPFEELGMGGSGKGEDDEE